MIFDGTAVNDTFLGTSGADTFNMSTVAGGNDSVTAGDGADTINWGADFDPLDHIDGGKGFDTLYLSGNHYFYPIWQWFNPGTMVNVEQIVCAAGDNYMLAMDDATVAAGKTLTIDDTAGTPGAGLLVFGDLETDGHFKMLGGGANDTLRGGQLSDKLYGGGSYDGINGYGGNDIINGGTGDDSLMGGLGADDITGGQGSDQFRYIVNQLDSMAAQFDTLHGVDFAGADTFLLTFAVTGIDARVTSGTLDAASFNNDMEAAIGTSLGIQHAMLFMPTSGSYAGSTFLLVDGDGVTGYQTGYDYVMRLDNSQHLGQLDVTDFTT